MRRDLDALRERARKATNSPQFRELAAAIPAAERNNPHMLLSWFRAAAALDPRGADTDGYRAATSALHELCEAQSTADRAARVYHDAISSGLVTQDEADRLWADPAAAEAKLAELRGTDAYWTNPIIQEAAALHYEMQALPAEDADADPANEPPADESARDAGDELAAMIDARGGSAADKYQSQAGEGPRAGEFEAYRAIKEGTYEPAPPRPADDQEERPSFPGPALPYIQETQR